MLAAPPQVTMDPLLNAVTGRLSRPVLFENTASYIRRASAQTESLAETNQVWYDVVKAIAA